MTSASKTDEAKLFLGAQIDFQFRDTLLQDATKASFFVRLMAETLYRDEAELRRILLELGPDGQVAANLAADFMDCRGRLQGIADLMKTAAGRVYLLLEDMEEAGEIVTTDAIYEPLKYVIAGVAEKEADRVPKFAN